MNDIPTSQGRLLVVDDIAQNRAILKRLFGLRGFDVAEVGDGPSALALIGEESFDAILLDIVMPGMNGFEVLKGIRKMHSAARLPVIMVTAKVEAEDIALALELGANDYITKPIDVRVATARVLSQLSRLKAERALVSHVEKLEAINERLKHEIAERERSEAVVRHMAEHDSLTGLANRVQFRDQLNSMLKRIDDDGDEAAILFVDLDRFKLINDTLGHRLGDLLLIAVAERLRRGAREGSIVARLGGDEFALICPRVRGVDDVSALADRIIRAIEQPFTIDGHQLTVNCSIGIAWAPTDGKDPDSLLANADLALYRAKTEACGGYRFFEPEMNERARTRRVIEGDLREAVDRNQFELHFQPFLNLERGRVSGLEALVRWRHPTRGMVPPLEFISVAEETGLINPLSRWILHEALREAKSWPADTKLAVNLSPMQFRTGTLLRDVVEALAATSFEAGRLELEITETVVLDSDRKTMRDLHELREMGVRISMDDFGTGYSSLSYLRKFPFDKIKIDQSFVRDLPGDGGSEAIIRAVVGLANSIGMVTTVEGVETAEQMEYLQAEGCTEIQGYLISRPVPAQDVLPLLGKRTMVERAVA